MCPKFDFLHLCRLAHLQISETEKKELELQLHRIVKWVDKLKEFKPLVRDDKNCQEPSCSPPLRPDETLPSLSSEEALSNAPEKEGGYFRVPKVIKSR